LYALFRTITDHNNDNNNDDDSGSDGTTKMDPNDGIHNSKNNKDKDEIKVAEENDKGRIEDGIDSKIEADNKDSRHSGTSEDENGGHGSMSENKDTKNGGSGVDSDSRGQGNTRYTPSPPHHPLLMDRFSSYSKKLGGVGHCFTWHVQVNLGFYFNFQIEELVHSGLCAMRHLGHNSIFTFAIIKILL
jgi:hypothetical protein